MNTCYACDEKATGTCDQSHNPVYQTQSGAPAFVPACERHRDDHEEPPTDALVKERIVRGRIAALKRQSDCFLFLVVPGIGVAEALAAAGLAEHRDGPVETQPEELALALYALDQSGLSAELQEKLCRMLAREMGL